MHFGKFFTLICVVVTLGHAEQMCGQMVSYNAEIAVIDKQVAEINKRKPKESKGIMLQDTTKADRSYFDPRIVGLFRKGHLEKISVWYEEESGAQWQSDYYFIKDSLAYISITCFRVMMFGGPNWYELSFKGEYWYVQDVNVGSRITTIPPEGGNEYTFTSAEIYDQANCLAGELRRFCDKP